ncbi:hypothetical protein [Qipengyuania spongiae]|uniref:Transposase n=1 Tax=Qipengyuania spongiae TaxID=2909673 RepID=A0ABY5T0G8_9SPHN|nr:hypothetical protein [Qipengyuania spongiae]UVI40252.1 hypothetical protein L1F33_04730 [Qipengyuania spongiae]
MKHYPPRAARARHLRIPAFHPVPVHPRADGWTHERQAQFIGCLAETRSVLAACRRVSMGRESAYRLRKRPGAAGFAAAWDTALGRAHDKVNPASAKSTGLDAAYRFRVGRLKVVMYAGRFTAIRRIPDHSALLQHLARLDRAVGDKRSGEDPQG